MISMSGVQPISRETSDLGATRMLARMDFFPLLRLADPMRGRCVGDLIIHRS